jgi:Uma2 family endonuclease
MLRYDRVVKFSLYALVGIADYWIINLVDRQLEIYRNPVPDKSQKYGWGYADEMILTAADYATPLAAPQARVAVADLLP